MIVKPGMVPPGGWHVPAEPGITLRASTHALLVDMLFKHRMRHGQDASAAKQEIDRYVCSRWPSFCNPDVTVMAVGGPDVVQRVSQYAALLAGKSPAGGYDLVPQSEADRRAEICAKCPLNKPWRSCGSCTATAVKILLAIRRMKNTSLDQKLGACLQCGAELQTAVHLPIGAGATSVTSGVYPECWRLTGE